MVYLEFNDETAVIVYLQAPDSATDWMHWWVYLPCRLWMVGAFDV
jgi:hypothetical protein